MTDSQFRERGRPPPLVSVIIAVKNGAETLAESVASIKRQTLADWELLLVDDGSTDGTPTLIERLADDNRVRLLSSPALGPSGARNIGIRQARGQYVAILDADDTAVPDRLSKQMSALESDDTLAAVASSAHYWVRPGVSAGIRPGSPYTLKELQAMMRKGANILWANSTMCWRRERLEELDGFDERFQTGEDAELMNRAVYKHAMVILGLREKLVWIRLSRRSLSSTSLREQRMVARFLETRNRCWTQGVEPPVFEDFLQQRPTRRERLRWFRHDVAAGLYREAGYRVASGQRLGVAWRILLSIALHPRYVARKVWRQRLGRYVGRP